MVRHNQHLPTVHFRKEWTDRVKVHLDQASKKISRRNKRQARAQKLFPRPVELLRPVVRCSSQRYNLKFREGRGFSLLELKEAGVPAMLARKIGIAVDHRRVSKGMELFQLNVERIKTYLASITVQTKKGAKDAELKKLGVQFGDLSEMEVNQHPVFAVEQDKEVLTFADEIDASLIAKSAFQTLRTERRRQYFHGRNQNKEE
ncbi:hypothetical protein PCE1_001854 [Barthelona sp. PCE]